MARKDASHKMKNNGIFKFKITFTEKNLMKNINKGAIPLDKKKNIKLSIQLHFLMLKPKGFFTKFLKAKLYITINITSKAGSKL